MKTWLTCWILKTKSGTWKTNTSHARYLWPLKKIHGKYIYIHHVNSIARSAYSRLVGKPLDLYDRLPQNAGFGGWQVLFFQAIKSYWKIHPVWPGCWCISSTENGGMPGRWPNCSLSFTNTSTFCKEFPLTPSKKRTSGVNITWRPGQKLSYCWVVAKIIKRVSALLKKTPTMKGRSSWSLVCKPAWCRCKRPEQDTTKPVNWRMSHKWHLKLLGKW